jgi:hypothetical protein
MVRQGSQEAGAATRLGTHSNAPSTQAPMTSAVFRRLKYIIAERRLPQASKNPYDLVRFATTAAENDDKPAATQPALVRGFVRRAMVETELAC